MLTTFKIIGTLSAIIPIALGVFSFKASKGKYRLFLFFLIFGLLTDLGVWLLYKPFKNLSYFLFVTYPLVEALFLVWFVFRILNKSHVKRFFILIVCCTITLWIVCHFIINKYFEFNGIFDTYYSIVVSFISGYALLNLSENNASIIRLPEFWFLLGVFVYCFCTFFVSSLLGTEILQKIWYINNLINVVSYLLFSLWYYFLSTTYLEKRVLSQS